MLEIRKKNIRSILFPENHQYHSNIIHLGILLLLLVVMASSTSLRAQIQWQAIGVDTSFSVVSMVSDVHGNVFATTEYQGVVRSTDHGKTWEFVHPGFNWGWRAAIAVFPSGEIFIADWSDGKGIDKSTDSGESWNSAGLDTLLVTALTSGPNQTLYAACNSQVSAAGLYRSTDGGKSWVNSGLNSTYIYSLTTNTRGDIFAVFEAYTYPFQGITRSTDGGQSWQVLQAPWTNAIGIGMNDVVFIGVNGALSLSKDYGQSWNEKTAGLDVADVLAIAARGSEVFTGTCGNGTCPYGYVYKSTDTCNTWVPVLQGWIQAITFDSLNNIYVGEQTGVQVSSDDGATWSSSEPQLGRTGIWSLAVSQNGRIFAGHEAGISTSDNNGDSWMRRLTTGRISSLATNGDSVAYAVNFPMGVYRSNNAGVSWNRTLLRDTAVFCVTTDMDGRAYAGGEMGIFDSPRGDSVWNFHLLSPTGGSFGAIATDSSNNVFTSADTSIFTSTDQGAHWSIISHIPSQISTIAVLDRRAMFIGTQSGGVFRSSDGGYHWLQSAGGIGGTSVRVIAIGRDRTLLAGTNQGVFISTDEGNSWTQADSGLATLSITSAILGLDGIGIVGTPQGVFRSLSHVTKIFSTKIVLPSQYMLEQNYPNPFNPSTAIRFSVPTRSRVHLSVFNILGQKVAELANEELSAGSFERIWNANVSSGLYFYRFEAVSVGDPSKRFVDVKKMILLK